MKFSSNTKCSDEILLENKMFIDEVLEKKPAKYFTRILLKGRKNLFHSEDLGG